MCTPLHALCLQELQTHKDRALIQLGVIFPQGNFALDVATSGKVGTALALPKGQVVLDHGCKGDGSLAQIKTQTSKGVLCIASIYGDKHMRNHILLWDWMDMFLSAWNWLIYRDFNHTKYMEDSVGPTPLMHNLERQTWNRLSDKLDLLDNRLMVVHKMEPHFTKQATYRFWFDQSRIDMSYSSNRGAWMEFAHEVIHDVTQML